VKNGLLQIHSSRPSAHGVEVHLVRMHKLIEEFNPTVVVMDPLSNMHGAGTNEESQAMLVRLIDYMRRKQITAFLVSLTTAGRPLEATESEVSSIVDTWLLLRDVELDGERNRSLYVLKSRGMPHSNQVREFLITSRGVSLVPAYLGTAGVLTGSARLNQEAKDRYEAQVARDEFTRKKLALAHRRKAVQAQIDSLATGLLAEEEEFQSYANSAEANSAQLNVERNALFQSRKAISGNISNPS
jgi:circadian clock protein KaiC